MSEVSDQYIDFLIEGVLTIVIVILGLFGNAFIIATLSRQQMRSSINLLFLSLACFDAIFLVCALLLLGIPSLSLQVESLKGFDQRVVPKISKVLEPVGYMAQTASTWTTVSVSVERYIAICHPLRARYLCSYAKARTCVIVVVLLSVCVNIPEFFRTTKIGTVQQEVNGTFNDSVEISLEENELFSEVYDMWLYLVLMYVIPFVIFVVLNGLIIKSIRSAVRRRRSLVKRMEKDVNLVAVLICVITVYFLCNLLRILYMLIYRYVSYYTLMDDISTTFIILNSSVNFVIYYIVCRKFRLTFLSLFCRCWCPQSAVREETTDNSLEFQKLNTLSAEK